MKKILALLLIATLSSPLHAQDNYGISMHGVPKYNASSDHLEYINPKAPKGGQIKMASIGSFNSVNPYAIKGDAAEGLHLIYDRLMSRVWDEAFTMYPLIAKNIEYPKDRSEVTFTIDERALFTDGNKITADDVIFSFETLRDSGRPNMRRIYSLAKEYKAIDKNKVHFKFSDGYDMETIMIFAMMPVLSKEYWSDKSFNKATLDIPITNGPYKINFIDAGRKITYQRNDNYWAKDLLPRKGLYNFDEITYDYYRDDNIAFEAFKAGEFDLRREYNKSKWERGYDFPSIKNGQTTKKEIRHYRPEMVNSFIFNTRNELFKDIRVRKALAMVFNFEWINKNLFHGKQTRIESFFPNSELEATKNISDGELKILTPWDKEIELNIIKNKWKAPTNNNPKEIRQNIIKAFKLLEQAGWIIIDGKLTNKATGRIFEFEITVNSPENEKIALSYKNNLKRLGVFPKIDIEDTPTFISRLGDYSYDMVIHYWRSSLSPGTEQYIYWSCEAAKQQSRFNYAAICNPAIDDISNKIASSKNRDELISYTRSLDRILTHGHYTIPLGYSGKDYISYKNNIKRPEITPIYGIVLESWWNDK